MKYEIFIQMMTFIGLATCGNGEAGAPCTSDLDCKTGFNIICINSFCKARAGLGSQCVTDNECLQGLICSGENAAIKTCAVPPSRPKMSLGGQCEQDSDCLEGFMCSAFNDAIRTCVARPNITGTGIAGSPCTVNTDCKTGFGLFCSKGTCQKVLISGSQCTEDSECASGKCGGTNALIKTCAFVCNVNADCGFGIHCISGFCTHQSGPTGSLISGSQCTEDSECASGKCGGTNALIKTCAFVCSVNADCGFGIHCISGFCTAQSGPTGTDVSNDHCSVDADCKTGFGLYCANNTCTAQKSIGSNCTLSSECLTGSCTTSLNGTQAVCATGSAQVMVPSLSLMVAAIFYILL